MQAKWLRLKLRDSRTPTTRTQKLSRRLLRNERCPRRPSRRAAVTSLFIRTPIRSQTNRKFYAPVSLLPENVVYRGSGQRFWTKFVMPRTFAYLRVSTTGQTTDNQLQEIAAAGFKVEPRRVVAETVERTQAGLSRVKAEGKMLGRPLSLTDDQRRAVERRLQDGVTVSALAREF